MPSARTLAPLGDPFLQQTAPVQPSDRGRRCAIWISRWASHTLVLDTATLEVEDLRHFGNAPAPEDCLLVIVSPADAERHRKWARRQTFRVFGPTLAAMIIDQYCGDDGDLRRRLRW